MMGLAIETAWPPMQASFLASLFEFVEALTVVFAVGTVRGWRPALAETALAFAVLLTLVVVPWAGADAYPSRSRAASSSAPSCSCIDSWLGIEAIPISPHSPTSNPVLST